MTLVADFWGVVDASGLSAPVLDGFGRMTSDLHAHTGRQPAIERSAWAAIGWTTRAVETLAGNAQPAQGSLWRGWCATDGAGPGVEDIDACISRLLGGKPAPDELRPPAAILLLHDAGRTCRILSDLAGQYPVYYAQRGGIVVFATRFLPLPRSGLIRWSLDPAAVLDFLTYEYVTGTRTLADKVSVLPAHSVLTIASQRSDLHSYAATTIEVQPDRSRRLSGTVDPLMRGLTAGVNRASRRARTIAVCLSGGLDSRALAGCAVRSGIAGLHALTFGPADCRDVRLAEQVAHRLGIDHRHVPIDGGGLERWFARGLYTTGGMVSCKHYHILSLADAVGDVDVVLDGLGGDALTGGHLKYFMLARRSASVARRAYHRHASAWSDPQDLRSILSPDLLRGVDYDPATAVGAYFQDDVAAWLACHRFDLQQRQRRFIQYGPHLLRTFTSVATPFYEPLVHRTLRSGPLGHLFEQRAYLAMFRRHLPEAAAEPDALRQVSLRRPLAVRIGKRFADAAVRKLGGQDDPGASPTDYPLWLRRPLRGMACDLLLPTSSRLHDLVRRDVIERLVDEHMTSQHDHTTKLMCLMTLSGFLDAVG